MKKHYHFESLCNRDLERVMIESAYGLFLNVTKERNCFRVTLTSRHKTIAPLLCWAQRLKSAYTTQSVN